MIGVALTEVAVRENAEVYAIIRPGTSRTDRIVTSPKVHVVYAELDSLEDVSGIPSDCDVFYHLAWAGTGRTQRDDAQIHEKNIKYTLDAVNLAKKAGCKRFVGAGSQAEYGPVDGIIDINTKYEPVMAYGIAKFAAGKLAEKLCTENNMEFVWGRIFSVYGPHDNAGTMLDQAISSFLKRENASFSAATQMWNYLYESDAGEIFYRLGKSEVKPGTYLVAHNESMPLKEYIKVMMSVYGPEARADFAPITNPAPLGLNVDAASTFEAIDYVPKVSFEQGIKKMIDSRK
jgi:nucleoside-diphosphate-sugar epimerase